MLCKLTIKKNKSSFCSDPVATHRATGTVPLPQRAALEEKQSYKAKFKSEMLRLTEPYKCFKLNHIL